MNLHKLFRINENHCFYCGNILTRNTRTMDHVFPKSKGGKNVNNLVPCCKRCNAHKSSYCLYEWREKVKESIVHNPTEKHSVIKKLDLIMPYLPIRITKKPLDEVWETD